RYPAHQLGLERAPRHEPRTHYNPMRKVPIWPCHPSPECVSRLSGQITSRHRCLEEIGFERYAESGNRFRWSALVAGSRTAALEDRPPRHPTLTSVRHKSPDTCRSRRGHDAPEQRVVRDSPAPRKHGIPARHSREAVSPPATAASSFASVACRPPQRRAFAGVRTATTEP